MAEQRSYTGGFDNRWLFTGKELDESTGLYYFGARFYNPSTFIWLSVDPLAEKRVWESPFSYCGNNPIARIDPSGMIWENSKQAKNLKESIHKRQREIKENTTKLENEINTGKGKFLFFSFRLNDKQVAKRRAKINDNEQRIKSLDKSIRNIDAIHEDSTNIYRLVNNENRNSVRKGDDGVINIEGSSEALHIHEITHISLSLNSEEGLQFNSDNTLKSTKYNGLFDEMEAYKAQYSFKPSSIEFNVKNIGDFDYGNRSSQVQMIKKLGGLLDKEGKPFYPAINRIHLEFLKNGTYKKLK